MKYILIIITALLASPAFAQSGAGLETAMDPQRLVTSIMRQIQACWNAKAGAGNMVVFIDAEYDVDGTLFEAEIAPKNANRYDSDPAFRAAGNSALNAVKQCSPLKGLPQKQYNSWHYIELTFDPKALVN